MTITPYDLPGIIDPRHRSILRELHGARDIKRDKTTPVLEKPPRWPREDAGPAARPHDLPGIIDVRWHVLVGARGEPGEETVVEQKAEDGRITLWSKTDDLAGIVNIQNGKVVQARDSDPGNSVESLIEYSTVCRHGGRRLCDGHTTRVVIVTTSGQEQ